MRYRLYDKKMQWNPSARHWDHKILKQFNKPVETLMRKMIDDGADPVDVKTLISDVFRDMIDFGLRDVVSKPIAMSKTSQRKNLKKLTLPIKHSRK